MIGRSKGSSLASKKGPKEEQKETRKLDKLALLDQSSLAPSPSFLRFVVVNRLVRSVVTRATIEEIRWISAIYLRIAINP